jgi:hypothetical protein
MTIAALEKLDAATAANVLAVAALRTAPDPGLGDKAFEERYASQADAVIEELSRTFAAAKPGSPKFRSAVSNTLTNEIKRLLLREESVRDALARAGQAGRLAPSIYGVSQPKVFRQRFAPFGISKDDVVNAIHRPDDYQHLLTDYAVEKDTISLFMKAIRPRDREAYWLLVQTHRVETNQEAQSAWRIYDTDVELTKASMPIDVLKAFVNVFGLPFAVEDKEYIFVEDVEIDKPKFEMKAHFPLPTEYFMSISSVKDQGNSGISHIGLGYVIDLRKYRAALNKHGRK